MGGAPNECGDDNHRTPRHRATGIGGRNAGVKPPQGRLMVARVPRSSVMARMLVIVQLLDARGSSEAPSGAIGSSHGRDPVVCAGPEQSEPRQGRLRDSRRGRSDQSPLSGLFEHGLAVLHSTHLFCFAKGVLFRWATEDKSQDRHLPEAKRRWLLPVSPPQALGGRAARRSLTYYNIKKPVVTGFSL